MKKNYLHFKTEELAKPIYRVIACDRFLQMLRNGQNALVRPRMWDDPFENFILNGTAVSPDGTEAIIESRDKVYGQCWSFHRETDAMWRIYSPEGQGVKVKTTIDKLFDSLYSHAGKFKEISCFIGKVQYFSQRRMKDVLDNVSIIDPSAAGIAETLLFKRKAFSPEREVRLIYLSNKKNFSKDVFSYPIDPNHLFEKAVLDPRLTKSEASKWMNKFTKAGFKNKISKSTLYEPPQDIFINVLRCSNTRL